MAAMSHPELEPFIAAAKKRGAGDDFLAALLTRRGWPADDVYNSLAEWWERDTGVAVPARRSAAENARDAFLYLLRYPFECNEQISSRVMASVSSLPHTTLGFAAARQAGS